MIYVHFMSPSPWFPELSTDDAEERDDAGVFEERLIEAVFAAAAEAKPKAHCLDLIGMLLGNALSKEQEQLVMNLTAEQAQYKAYLLEAMVINQKNGCSITEKRIRDLMQKAH